MTGGLVEKLPLLCAGQEAVMGGEERCVPLRDGLDWLALLHKIVAPSIRSVVQECRRGHADVRLQYERAEDKARAELEEWLRCGFSGVEVLLGR